MPAEEGHEAANIDKKNRARALSSPAGTSGNSDYFRCFLEVAVEVDVNTTRSLVFEIVESGLNSALLKDRR